MSHEATNDREGRPERVGRVMVDYGEPDRTPVDTSEGTRDSLGVIILAGIIAALLMVGAMLLLLQGVFEV